MNTDTASGTALHVTCARDDLAGALAVVARALSSRGAVQVLSGILLQVEEGRLTLAATDMEISLRVSIFGDVSGDAATVVPGRLLADLVRLLPDDSVTLAHEEGEGVLSVVSGSHSSRLSSRRSTSRFSESARLRCSRRSRRSRALRRETSRGRC